MPRKASIALSRQVVALNLAMIDAVDKYILPAQTSNKAFAGKCLAYQGTGMMACRLAEGFCDLGWKRVFLNFRPSNNSANRLKL